jgi:hypothetical protein
MTLYFFQRYFRRREKREDEREAAKVKESILVLRSIHANGRLTVANSIAIRDGKVNGAMSDALNLYEKADQDLYNYLLEQNAHKN